jgi:zinc and cadmium transporter
MVESVPTFVLILAFSFLGSIGSLIGGLVLLYKKDWAQKISGYLVSFAAGVLLSAAFLDLLPEALEAAEEAREIFLFTLAGMVVFFLVERFLLRLHYHGRFHDLPPVSSLVIIGDALHNFIDGIIIATAFLVNIPLGVVTSLAIISHEIPQEIGDFGILLFGGMKQGKVFLINLSVALITVLGAILAFWFASTVNLIIAPLLSFAAGNFIYIAASDLIPEIHHGLGKEKDWLQVFLFVVGIVFIWLLLGILEKVSL